MQEDEFCTENSMPTRASRLIAAYLVTRGDSEFNVIVDLLRPWITHIIYRCHLSAAEWEDAFQAALLGLYLGLQKFDGTKAHGSPMAYLRFAVLDGIEKHCRATQHLVKIPRDVRRARSLGDCHIYLQFEDWMEVDYVGEPDTN